MNAVCCAELTREPSPRVHLARYWLKVIRVDALSHAAKVVQLKPLGDCTPMVLIAPTVGIDLFSFIFKCAVPAWV